MTLTAEQSALLRAKKALKAGNTSFKPRGRKNKQMFKELKQQMKEGCELDDVALDASPSPPQPEREQSPQQQGDHLYIMQYSNDKRVLKIGRSSNVEGGGSNYKTATTSS